MPDRLGGNESALVRAGEPLRAAYVEVRRRHPGNTEYPPGTPNRSVVAGIPPTR